MYDFEIVCREFMARERKTLGRMASEVMHILTCDKILSDQELQHIHCLHLENQQKKTYNFRQNPAVFLPATDSDNKFKIIKYYEEKDKNIFLTYLSSLEQEPTFKIFLTKQFLLALAILKAEALHQRY